MVLLCDLPESLRPKNSSLFIVLAALFTVPSVIVPLRSNSRFVMRISEESRFNTE